MVFGERGVTLHGASGGPVWLNTDAALPYGQTASREVLPSGDMILARSSNESVGVTVLRVRGTDGATLWKVELGSEDPGPTSGDHEVYTILEDDELVLVNQNQTVSELHVLDVATGKSRRRWSYRD